MSRPERTYECSIVDLQATNPELYNNLDFSLFTTATLIDDIKNTSVDYQVVERHVYPYHPEENEVIFNSEPLKITASVVDIKYQIESPNSTFQQIMDKKAAEATDWMLSGNGYVVAIQSSDGQWKELLFMDTNDIATAQKVLRINENGIGFSTTGAQGPYTNAWTIDGQLVADFITTGHMTLDRLQGGTATLGGNNNGNGKLQIKNASGTVIITIDKDGIVYGNGKFKVDANGKETATGVDITGDIKAENGYLKAGYIGTNGDWEITGDGIHSKNGPTAPYGQSTQGTYIGKDGFCNNGSTNHVWIQDGQITCNGTIYTSGVVDTKKLLLREGQVEVIDGGNTYSGATGQITWTSGSTTHSLAFHDGIITGYS